MKKKTLLFGTLALTAGLTLASCNGNTANDSGNRGKQKGEQTLTPATYTYKEAPADEVYSTDGGTLDIYLNYSGTSGITYRSADAFSNGVEQKTYTQGTLLPTWEAFAAKTKTTLRDAAGSYAKSKDNDTYTELQTAEYKANGQDVDLFYNSTANINKMGKANEAINLEEHLDEMPNLKAFLTANPTIHKSLLENGKMYYAPYFDGYNDVERMFMIDSKLVQDVLDAANFEKFDTTLNGGKTPAKNVVQKAAYTPYIDAENNYPADTTVKVLKNGVAKEITIKKTKNIIVRQNELLKADAGVTGAKLAEDFRQYLNAAYGHEIGEGKTFESYSDIFVGETAAYNADELIALMRVVKANPGVITNDKDMEVETLFPRGGANNRVDNIADFMQVWGVFGMTSKKDMLYFLQDGTLNDAATTPATYDALKNLSAIYDEGLILDEFWLNESGVGGTTYLNRYYKKTDAKWGYGLLMYDYAASQAQANDMAYGIGTNPSTRQVANLSVKGITPMLPPLAYWNTGTTAKYDAPLSDHTGKTLTRYSEENRSLKSTAWCIPANTDNLAGALRLMDYLYSPMGSKIQDFGPEKYWQKPGTNDKLANGGTVDATKSYVATDLVDGEETPIMSDQTKAMLAAKNGMDFWSFMREYIGSTHGVGAIRSKSIQVQSLNYYAQPGLVALQTAIEKGVVVASRVDKVAGKNTWDTTVPTAGYGSITTTVSDTYQDLTAFWASDKFGSDAIGWVKVVKEAYDADLSSTKLGENAKGQAYNFTAVKNQFEIKNKSYLFTYATNLKANDLAQECVPAYAKTSA